MLPFLLVIAIMSPGKMPRVTIQEYHTLEECNEVLFFTVDKFAEGPVRAACYDTKTWVALSSIAREH
jgi:hypothetical protein